MAVVSFAELGQDLQRYAQVHVEREVSQEDLHRKAVLLWKVFQSHRDPKIERSAGMRMHYIPKEDDDSKSLGDLVLDSVLKSYFHPDIPIEQ